MEKIKLAVFHYHFLPGGITTVIKLSLISLLKQMKEIEKVALVSGRNNNADNLLLAIKSSVPNIDIELETVPEIDYLSREHLSEPNMEQNIRKILEKYKGFIYWIHNHHIGKNPFFTKIITEYAADSVNEKFLFHIHDFPECSRFSNYKYLKETVENPYPCGDNIKYAVLNSRDYSYMKKAGIDNNSISLLPNPVIQKKDTTFKISEKEKSEIKNSLYKKTKGIFDFDPEKPVFLYPVRAIRRKNILEAALITMLTGDGGNLIQTLPGISAQEVNYSDYIEGFYKKGYIKGLFGTGEKGSPSKADFADIISITDLVVSSSVMEGFGYIFTDTVTWGKPILSHYLETSEDFIPIFTENSSYFYKSLRIPLSKTLKTNLEKHIEHLFLNLDTFVKEIIKQKDYINTVISKDTVDFSCLPYNMQGEYLIKTKKSKQLKSEIEEINNRILQKSAELLKAEPETEYKDISKYYGEEVFAENFRKILKLYGKGSPDKFEGKIISKKLLDFYNNSESLRLLNT